MKRNKAAACGFMDNASALPTTPQAPHQPQKRRHIVFLGEQVFAKMTSQGPPDVPPERPPV
jgi:hypothetical protein